MSKVLFFGVIVEVGNRVLNVWWMVFLCWDCFLECW